MFGVRDVVELPKKVDRFEILASAILIWNPLPLLAGIIEIQHRRHSIDAEAIDMKALAPEQRVGGKKVAHLMAAKIKDQCAPILVSALARVLMFVKSGAVKVRQRPVIAGEMRRHPINNHANARFVKRVYEKLKVIRRAVAARGCKKSGHLYPHDG